VPMNTTLRDAMKQLRNASEGAGRVFRSRDGRPFKSIRTRFTTACRNAKLSDVTPHTLRHTFASRLAITGSWFENYSGAGWLKGNPDVFAIRSSLRSTQGGCGGEDHRKFPYGNHYSQKSLRVSPYAPVAQLDRALASGARGQRFESSRAYQPFNHLEALTSSIRVQLC